MTTREPEAPLIAGSGAVPWWLWPNVLGLDAPILAMLWQELFARAFGISLPPAPRLALFFAVWAVYLGDRWLDSRDPAGADRQARHLFPRRHPLVVGFLFLTAAAGGTLCALSLHWQTLLPGLILGAIVGLYFLWNAWVPGCRKQRIKELLVSIIFAAGCALGAYAYGAGSEFGFWVGLTGFVGICLANSTLIDCLQAGTGRREQRFEQMALWVAFAVLLLLPFGILPSTVGLALVVAGLLLRFTRPVARRVGPALGGLYADAALLSPLLAWGLLR